MRILVLMLTLCSACAPAPSPTVDAPVAVTALAEVTVNSVNSVAQSDRVLIDVRTPREFATGRAPGAVNIPLSTLQDELAQIPTGAEPFVICQSGGRSSRATAMLASHGIAAHNVTGGMSAWVRAGLPTE